MQRTCKPVGETWTDNTADWVNADSELLFNWILFFQMFAQSNYFTPYAILMVYHNTRLLQDVFTTTFGLYNFYTFPNISL